MHNDTDTPRTIADIQLEDGTRMTAGMPSLGVLTLSFSTAPEVQLEEQETTPAPEVPHDAAVSTQITLEDGTPVNVDPVKGNVEISEALTVRALSGLSLTRSEARELATALLDASAPSFADGDPDEIREHVAAVKAAQHHEDDSPTEHVVSPPSEDSLQRYYFPRTRTWRGEKVPASGVHLYRTVDQRDVVEVEYVDTPEGPVMLIDGRRPIALDDTNRFMTDVALYRHATDAVNAMIRRREAGAR